MLLFVLGGLAFWGISQAVTVASMLTLIEILGLLSVVMLLRGHQVEMQPATDAILAAEWKVGAIVIGAFLAFYAYLDFEDMVNIAEEVREPEKNVPRAIIAALVISTLLYGAVVFAAIALVPPEGLGGSDAPLSEVFRQVGVNPAFITLVGMFAVVNGALIQIIMASRIQYGMSAKGWLPAWFGRVNSRTHTPVLSTVIVVSTIIAVALLFPLRTLAEFTSYLVLAVFTLINFALIRLRDRPAPMGVRVYPAWIPWFGASTSLALLIARVVLE